MCAKMGDVGDGNSEAMEILFSSAVGKEFIFLHTKVDDVIVYSYIRRMGIYGLT